MVFKAYRRPHRVGWFGCFVDEDGDVFGFLALDGTMFFHHCGTRRATNWQRLAARLRRALGLTPPSLEEADVEMAKAEEAPMSDEEIERIVSGVTKEG